MIENDDAKVDEKKEDEKKVDEKKEEDSGQEIKHKILQGAAAENISRYGSAAKEHLVAFSGVDNESGKSHKKGLKSISQSKVNEDYRKANIKQQAGFSAEVKSVARKNAKNIVNKDKTRYIRSDDLGRTNDQIIDIAVIGANGKEVRSLGAQMKFVGSSADKLLDNLQSKKYSKYLKANAILDIPDDFYEDLVGRDGSKGIIDQRIDILESQILKAEKDGKTDAALKKKTQLEDYRKIRKRIRKSGLTNTEAIEARERPKLSTAKDIGKLAHSAGVEQAKTGAIVSGSVSLVKNVVACIKGEQEPNAAAVSVVKDIGSGAVFSYATSFSGAVIKGSMQNSSSTYIRAISKTNLPSSLVSSTINTGKTMKKYLHGELTGAQCVEQLGRQGVGEIGSAMFTTFALAAVSGSGSIALQVVAGIAGSTLGYAAATAVYSELATSLKEHELAIEERIRIEAECEEAVRLICQYRTEMNATVEHYLTQHYEAIDGGFKAMDEAILQNDTNGFISGNAMIQEKLGYTTQFKSQGEFDDLMLSDIALKM